MLRSSSIACSLARLGDKGLFNTENILQIADVHQAVVLVFLLFFS